MYSENTKIREIQEESLVALKYFHELCTSNGIHYSIHAGTMIGAVRDKGFIPWDDDVDLSMTRAEYRKWQELLRHIELERYYSFDQRSYASPRLCLHRPDKPLVWLTIFIYDYISEKPFVQKLKKHIIAYYYIQISAHENGTTEKKRGIKGLTIALIHFIGKHRSIESILRRYVHFCEYGLVGKRHFIQRANDRYCWQGVEIVLPAECMQEYMLVPYEDTMVEMSKAYDMILTTGYGPDYMTPQIDTTKEETHEHIRENLKSRE